MSVLSPPPAGNDYSFSILTLQMETANKLLSQKKGEAVGSSFDSQINSIEREKEQWAKIEKDVGEATTKLSTTIGRLRVVSSTIDAMMTNVNKAGLDETDADYGYNSDIYASAFDAQMKSLTQALEGSSSAPNLLGSAEPTMKYKISPNQETISVTGSSINNDYSIVDSDGKTWILDRSAGTLKRYDTYPDEPTSTVGGLIGGLRLDSLTGDQITFTVAPDTASPESFTGTLKSDGLPVFDTWFYDNLSTDSARTEAMEDLVASKAIIDYQISRYESEMAVAKFYEQRAINSSSTLNSEKNDVTIEKAIAVGAAQEEMNRQYEAAINAVATAAKMKNNYTNMFSSLNKSPMYKLFSLLS
ncbi:MAG: hypothetical protein OQJ97_17265 [Rhodospirillales bacterium]|nr:hypothetical protein [Rhodospirillales bacterium]